jgi:16S rRNA (cytosine1402-N4)-methyltransferase
MSASSPHSPVLYQEIIHALQPRRRGYYVDCTVGVGGHATGILEASSPDGILLGLDLDPNAIRLARQRLAPFGSRAFLVKSSYTTLVDQITRLGWKEVDGILVDLGVSSMQLDAPERGFSFLKEGPLDMRFDPDSPLTAADLVNSIPEGELAELFQRYGEERASHQIAKAIVRSRPICTTEQLARLVEATARRGKGNFPTSRRIHPATRVFQALRIAVNRELESLETLLPQAVMVLKPGGRLAVISFHSLEDRIVKRYFQRESRDCICPPRQPVCTCGHRAAIQVITSHPISPGTAEIHDNPRARSARLRIAQKI